MAAYMWNGLQPVTSFTLIPNPNPNPNPNLGHLQDSALAKLAALEHRADVFEP